MTGRARTQSQPDRPAAWRELGAQMRALGYDEVGFATRLGLAPPITLRPGDEARLGRRLDRSESLDACIARWFLGLDSTTAIRVTPDAGALIASDPVEPERPDQVTGPDNAARLLARLTPRRPVRRALDLGCGNGIQALRCARHAHEVVATDVNPRAIALTEVSAELSGVTNITTRTGSWLDAVDGEMFDLVVCNPPFVLGSPDPLTYRDTSAGLTEPLVAAIPSALAPSGIAVILANWVDAPAPSPVADTLVLRLGIETAAEYAQRWCEPLRLRQPDRYAEQLDAWIRNLHDVGIEHVTSGAIVLARTDEPSSRTVDLPGGVHGDAGEHVVRVLDAMRAPTSDDDVAASAPVPVDGMRIDRSWDHEAGWTSDDAVVTSATELGVTVLAPEHLDRFLRTLDGHTTVAAAAELTGTGRAGAIACARACYEHGLLRLDPRE